jgi:hypothetical protein
MNVYCARATNTFFILYKSGTAESLLRRMNVYCDA